MTSPSSVCHHPAVMSNHRETGRTLLAPVLPVEIVLAPDWWQAQAGINFDQDFFSHPTRRVEAERKMEQVLYERWGRFGLGADRNRELPLVGATHLAAGFLLSEMLGCQVEYRADGPPRSTRRNARN